MFPSSHSPSLFPLLGSSDTQSLVVEPVVDVPSIDAVSLLYLLPHRKRGHLCHAGLQQAFEFLDEIYEDVQASFEEEGLEVTELDEDALQEWIDATEAVPQNWIDEQDDDVPAEEMYDRLLELSDQ